MDNQENIKCLIPKPITPIAKLPMYHSIFTESVKKEHKLNRDCHRTMGIPKVQLDPSSQFLKKNTRKVTRSFTEQVKCDKKLPRVPKKEAGQSETRSQKNILKMNIVDASKKVPPLPKCRIQDTKDGHVINLCGSGLEPNYSLKNEYGKTPVYIKKIKKQFTDGRHAEEKRIQAIKPPLRILSPKEREEILSGLKTNWDELNKTFLLLPVLTDTIPKIKKKHMLHQQLTNLEKDIDLLQRHRDIYVWRE